MGPVARRSIPVRSTAATRKIPPPGVFSSKTNLSAIQEGTPVLPALDKRPSLTQTMCSDGSDNASDSVYGLEFSTRIGSKVRVSGSKTGTLLFFGKTSFSDGLWCGISLDEASGKNDGSVNGIRYFTCVPAHGMFVRSTKIEFLPRFESGGEASVRAMPKVGEEPKVAEVVPRFRLPVPMLCKRPTGSVTSGRIQKHGSAQKKTGLKRRFLLDANLNSTTTIFSKEAGRPTNSTEDLADGVENDPPQIPKTAAVTSRLQRFQGRPSNVKPTEPPRVCNALPTSLNSTVTINLNSTVTVPDHQLNCGDKVSPLAPEQSSKLSVKEDRADDINVSGCSKLPDYAPKSLTLDCTSDFSNSVKSPETLSRRSQELFMNLSPSKVSSPLHLDTENPNNVSFLGHSFEISVAPDLTSEVRLSQGDESKTLLVSNNEDVHLHGIDAASSQPVSIANQTVVIEAPTIADQCLNCTFQVDDHAKPAEHMVLPEEISCPGSGALKSMVHVPLIEDDEHSVEESNCGSFSVAGIVHQTDFSELPAPKLINNSFIVKKIISSPCSAKLSVTESNLSPTQVPCEKAHLPFIETCVNTTVCIETKTSGISSATNAGDATFIASLNETFCCNTKDAPPPIAERLAGMDDCNEFSMAHECSLLHEKPVSSTPACRVNQDTSYSLSTICTPIHKSGSWNGHPASLDKSSTVPSRLPWSDALQISSSSDQSIGILSLSQMPDFTLADSMDSSLGYGSPVSPSFCDRMFPIHADYKPKRKLSCVLEFDESPVCLQRSSMKKLDSTNIFSPWSVKNVGEDKLLSSDSKNEPACQTFPEIAKGGLASVCKFQSSRADEVLLSEESVPGNASSSLLDLSACAAVTLPDDSIFDLSACSPTRLPDDSLSHN